MLEADNIKETVGTSRAIPASNKPATYLPNQQPFSSYKTTNQSHNSYYPAKAVLVQPTVKLGSQGELAVFT